MRAAQPECNRPDHPDRPFLPASHPDRHPFRPERPIRPQEASVRPRGSSGSAGLEPRRGLCGPELDRRRDEADHLGHAVG